MLTSIVDADAKSKFATVARQLLPDAPPRPKKPTGPNVIDKPAVPRHLTLASWITAGGAVATLGAGIVLGLETRSKYNSCAADINCGDLPNGTGTKATIKALELTTLDSKPLLNRSDTPEPDDSVSVQVVPFVFTLTTPR